MSGHSKWSKVKHQKSVTDLRKGKVFSQLARQISLAVAEGKSGDQNENPRLRMVLEKAREANLPKENVQRAIVRGLGKGSGGMLSEVVIEGYGPGGVAFLVKALTDNPNRTKSEIKSLFSRYGGNTGEPGSVTHIFSSDSGRATYTVPVSDDRAHAVSQLIELITEHEDVEAVSHNADFPPIR